MPNIFESDWDMHVDRGAYRWKRSFVGRRSGAEKLGASLYELAPGASTFPLHVHHANEELIVVLSGHLVLRTIDVQQELREGDVVACPTGRRGAHRLDNRGSEPARILIVSTMVAPELNEYPDSGLVWARTYAPGDARGEQEIDVVGEAGGIDPLSLP